VKTHFTDLFLRTILGAQADVLDRKWSGVFLYVIGSRFRGKRQAASFGSASSYLRAVGSQPGPPWVFDAQPFRQEVSDAEISPLRRRMIEDMMVRNLSPATQRSYLAAVSKLSWYFGRSPDRLKLEDIRAFQGLVAIGISWPALNQIVCVLRFYGVTLGHDAIPERISYAREPSKLPVVLSADEVVRFLGCSTMPFPHDAST
jgi:integrase-like protein